MKLIETERISPVAAKLTVEIDQKEAGKALDRAYSRLKNQIQLKGFRPGKAPRSILERRFGPQVDQEVAESLIKETADQAVAESGLKPVVLPKAEPGTLKKGQPYTYTLTVETRPEIQIEGYLGLKLTCKEREITDELVDSRLEELRQAHATLEPAPDEASIQENDYVQVNLKTVPKEGQAKEVNLEGMDLAVGKGRFNADLEAALVGLRKGQRTEVETSFPPDFYHDGLAGKTATLEVEVVEIRTPKTPQMDDEFAKSVGTGFGSLEELKKTMRQQLEGSAAVEADRRLQDSLLDQLLERTKFEVPEGLVDLETERMVAQVENGLVRRGLNFQAAGIDLEKLEADLKPQALRRAQEDLILEAIALKEGWEIDEKDLEAGFEELAERSGQNLEEIRRFHEEQNMIESFRSGLLRRQTLKKLIDGAEVTVEKFEGQEAPKDENEAAAD